MYTFGNSFIYDKQEHDFDEDLTYFVAKYFNFLHHHFSQIAQSQELNEAINEQIVDNISSCDQSYFENSMSNYQEQAKNYFH
ncbi:hypothetical protein T10_9830 [Trichinella papuae]|uniref:Uncharacterized protein n=1 Tax=Trichinella papuae TaxID=268474 RepID=A0A0V1MSN0_9BILA|nr:hypothetical protein T10_9830 [Trichinella papuae]